MKAKRLQTIFPHGGYEMRSHSETRWAAMMDALRITWLYEPRVISTRHGGYMPDFYLPAVGMFVEVKGPSPTLEEREKAADVQTATGCPVVFAYGRPEMLCGELFSGFVSYFEGNRAVTFSTADIGAGVLKHCGIHTYAAYMTAGEHQKMPHTVEAIDMVAEVVYGLVDRSQREQYMHSLHAPLNRAKSRCHSQASAQECVLAKLSSRVIERTQEVA